MAFDHVETLPNAHGLIFGLAGVGKTDLMIKFIFFLYGNRLLCCGAHLWESTR